MRAGAQWTLAPLWTLVAPEWAAAWSSYFLEAADAGGFMPEAPVDGEARPSWARLAHADLVGEGGSCCGWARRPTRRSGPGAARGACLAALILDS